MAQFRQISIKIADDDAHAVFVEGQAGKGHIVMISAKGKPTTSMLKHSDARYFDLDDENTIEKIKVQDAYRINNIKYADIENDVVEQD
ncbi:MAG: hypothetical protein LKJ37_02370 [Ligilactobacillus acidipiscis]|jgi:hypothetical protein|nr:hypothetical protein [Ligilactobacillus acidipiscis]MCI1953812.1 hypothetical protein [Ligilactobacillus acidipiscis]